MGLNIATLMWMRTTVNYQYRYGTNMFTAIKCVQCLPVFLARIQSQMQGCEAPWGPM